MNLHGLPPAVPPPDPSPLPHLLCSTSCPGQTIYVALLPLQITMVIRACIRTVYNVCFFILCIVCKQCFPYPYPLYGDPSSAVTEVAAPTCGLVMRAMLRRPVSDDGVYGQAWLLGGIAAQVNSHHYISIMLIFLRNLSWESTTILKKCQMRSAMEKLAL